MRTAGAWLIFAAVALRTAVVLADHSRFPAILGWLAAYGVLLLGATWLSHRMPRRLSPRINGWALAYLLVQSAIVTRLLVVSTYEDFFALLFVPLSLDAVGWFGRRVGFTVIAGFSLMLLWIFQFSHQGRVFGSAMAVLYAGECFLFGAYAYQVQKAEAAREHNRRTFAELQAAHVTLQGYADQATSLAVERERNRLARELHDSVTQTVFSMNLAAQSSRLLLDRDPPRAAEQLLRLEELATNAQGEIHSLVTQLGPRALADEGLPAALKRLAAEREARDGLRITLQITGRNAGRGVSEAEAEALLAIAQEALANVAKHSGTAEAVVRLDLDETVACLEIEDGGAGFDAGAIAARSGHLGLAGMAERAREIGWTFSVESARGGGTRIRATFARPAPGGGVP